MSQNQTISPFKVIAAAVVFGIIVVGVWMLLTPTGYNEGYAPTQPIPFSHKLHAGTMKMPCMYCHVGADKSRHASIPALSVCMNCHQVVKTDSPHIKKLTEAYKSGTPIQWVKVHMLPDFVFFNHQRHIARDVKCQTCHGDIASMEKVSQHASLAMGWCVNCHRKPENHAPVNCTTCHQ